MGPACHFWVSHVLRSPWGHHPWRRMKAPLPQSDILWQLFLPERSFQVYTPEKKKHVPWKWMVGRCILLLKYFPFLRDMLIFGGGGNHNSCFVYEETMSCSVGHQYFALNNPCWWLDYDWPSIEIPCIKPSKSMLAISELYFGYGPLWVANEGLGWNPGA